MKTEVKIYRIHDFIRFNQKGVLDCEQSKEIVHDIASAASFLGNHNIMIDMRETTIDLKDMHDMMEIALEFSRFKPFIHNKLASIIPDTEERKALARQFKAYLAFEGIQFMIFTDYDKALDWLSDITQINLKPHETPLCEC